MSEDAGRTTMALAELGAGGCGVTIRSLSVTTTTLDDVFVHYTGRGLHDANAAPARHQVRGLSGDRCNARFPSSNASCRKFIRTPALLVMTLLMPVLNLVVLGNAFGGRIRHLNVAIVDEDGGPAARRVREAVYALQMNGDMLRPITLRQRGRRRARRARRRRAGRRRSCRRDSRATCIRASDRTRDCCSTTPTTS